MIFDSLERCHGQLTVGCTNRPQDKIIHYRLFKHLLHKLVKNELVNKFWSYFDENTKVNSQAYKPFIEAVEFLIDSFKQVEKTRSHGLSQVIKEKFYTEFKSQIISHKPHLLKDYIDVTYLKAFKVFLIVQKNRPNKSSKSAAHELEGADDDSDSIFDFDEDEENSIYINDKRTHCNGCSKASNNCECKQIYKRFRKINEFLRDINLLENLVDETVISVAQVFIEKKVSSKCKSNYSNSYIDFLSYWVNEHVKEWILQIYSSPEKVDNMNLSKILKDAYAEVRVSSLYEIIIEYPNSEAAIYDLKMCLEQSVSSDFRLNLIDSVKQSLIQGLLHPGVNTFNILTAYIAAIKALRALDPTGLIMQLVTEPVRKYLKSRTDTVRCIVTALTDEEHHSELNREMIKTTSQTNENGVDSKTGTVEMNIPTEGERCTVLNFETWRPDPIKLTSSDDPTKSSRFSDIVSILVNIYETKDLFVEEYQKLLSQRLLNRYDECNLETELRNLELLTMRFSDCELHRCEVMLKDVQTSKRINKRILSGDINDHRLENFRNLDVLIVSSPFWPEKFGPMATISDETPEIEFPAEITEAIQTYTKAFEAIQASRTLHWRHHLGSVNLDLTLNGKIQNFTVSPLHASLLYLFKERKSWRLNELVHRTSLPAAILQSRLALWQRNGIIDCVEDKYDLLTS